MEYRAFTTCEQIPSRPYAEVFARLLEQIEISDQGGLDGFFLAEHHSNARHSLTASPNLLLRFAEANLEHFKHGASPCSARSSGARSRSRA